MPSDKKGDYEVGYGKPPRNTRFQKGQSGNPSGRAPGNKNLKTLLIDTLNEPVVVAENGGRLTISKRQAIVKQLVNQSANGDWRAVKLLFDMLHGDRRRQRTGNRGELVRRGRRKGHRTAEGSAER